MEADFADDLELFTLVAGLRPLAKKEGPLADPLLADAAPLAPLGSAGARAANGTAFAGRDAGALARAVELEETEVTSREPATRRAAILELGRLLGRLDRAPVATRSGAVRGLGSPFGSQAR